MPGGWEWIIVLIVALIIFGKRLPEVARGLGKSLTEFKKGLHEVDETKNDVVKGIKKVKDDVVDEFKDATARNNSRKMD